MTDWTLYGGPLDGELVHVPAGRPVVLAKRLADKTLGLSAGQQHAAATAALQQGKTVAEAQAAAAAAAFDYIPELGARRARFIFTRGIARTDQQEDA